MRFNDLSEVRQLSGEYITHMYDYCNTLYVCDRTGNTFQHCTSMDCTISSESTLRLYMLLYVLYELLNMVKNVNIIFFIIQVEFFTAISQCSIMCLGRTLLFHHVSGKNPIVPSCVWEEPYCSIMCLGRTLLFHHVSGKNPIVS